DDIDIEISVLSPMQPVDDYRNIEVGKHGVLVQRGRRSGVFLPQVAPEQGWNREEMLQNLCGHKAGLDPEAYKDPHTRLYAFTAQVFHEEK
ncbi:MAG: AMMECR1 domain-containing protein, partial [Armatimonadota bacterium]